MTTYHLRLRFDRFKKTFNHHQQTIPEELSHNGGGERDRTDDLMLAKHALSQLSYTPLRRSIQMVEP